MGENRGVGRTIVIVDDNAGFRASARRVLEDEGYRVLAEAADGSSGLQAALEAHPEVALIDVQLPDIDGFEVASRLLALDPGLVIVLVSSRDRSQYGSRVEASGARGFITKGELSGPALERLLE
jgi:two-component system, NarL family, nitrate/nitrite response regulator NarL